jgi:hypothetical protein
MREGNDAATPVTIAEKTSTMGAKPRGQGPRIISKETIHA